MIELQQGDLISYQIRDNKFGIAHILIYEKLISSQYHLALLDVVFESEFEYDYQGNTVLLNPPNYDFTKTNIAIDHLAISEEALQASNISHLGNLVVTDDAMDGYRVWLAIKRENAFKKGMYIAENFNGEPIDNNVEEIEEQEIEEQGNKEQDIKEERDEADNNDDAVKSIIVRPWQDGWGSSVPIGRWLFEWNMHFNDGLEATELCGYVLSKSNNLDEINEIVERFSLGDYSAGHELLDYGNAASEVLGKKLTPEISAEFASDILQVLGDLGTDTAYKYITDFFLKHYTDDNDLAVSAIRGYAYVVMVTNGENKVLAEHLEKLFSITNPECEEDIKNAKEGSKKWESKDNTETTSNPFGTLDT